MAEPVGDASPEADPEADAPQMVQTPVNEQPVAMVPPKPGRKQVNCASATFVQLTLGLIAFVALAL